MLVVAKLLLLIFALMLSLLGIVGSFTAATMQAQREPQGKIDAAVSVSVLASVGSILIAAIAGGL